MPLQSVSPTTRAAFHFARHPLAERPRHARCRAQDLRAERRQRLSHPLAFLPDMRQQCLLVTATAIRLYVEALWAALPVPMSHCRPIPCVMTGSTTGSEFLSIATEHYVRRHPRREDGSARDYLYRIRRHVPDRPKMSQSRATPSGPIGSGLYVAPMTGRDLEPTSIRRWRIAVTPRPEREPVSYCCAAMSTWFAMARSDGQSGTSRAFRDKQTMIEIRNTLRLSCETVFSELGVEASRPVTRAVGTVVTRTPVRRSVRAPGIRHRLFEAGADASVSA